MPKGCSFLGGARFLFCFEGPRLLERGTTGREKNKTACSGKKRCQIFDSDSAATPSLGRRVGTEASGGRQCCCAIVPPASWAFCFVFRSVLAWLVLFFARSPERSGVCGQLLIYLPESGYHSLSWVPTPGLASGWSMTWPCRSIGHGHSQRGTGHSLYVSGRRPPVGWNEN